MQFDFTLELYVPTNSLPYGHSFVSSCTYLQAEGTFSCFLWERSLFYTKTRVAMKAWELRYFTFGREGITSVPNRTFCKNEIRYSTFVQIDVDEAHLILKMYTPGTQSRDCMNIVLAMTDVTCFPAHFAYL